ncbi:MAG: hypothetical protein MJ193_00495, partial [Clostridia bacterium]|nr:hypothetical protein [Clostridia bacterium]
MKDFLKKLIASKEARAKELRKKIQESNDVNEVRSLGDTLQAVLDELTEAKAQLDALDDPADNGDGGSEPEANGQRNGFNPIAAMNQRNSAVGTSDLAYRKAFRKFRIIGEAGALG